MLALVASAVSTAGTISHHTPTTNVASYYKSWKMTAALPSGALLYVAGLATREAGSFHPENKGLYIASRVLTLDATSVFPLSQLLVTS